MSKYSIPNRRGEVTAGSSAVVSYKLNDVEMAYLQAGRLDKILTAEERGLDLGEPVRHVYRGPETKSKPPRITGDQLRVLRYAGMSVQEIADHFGVKRDVITTLLDMNGLYALSKRDRIRKHRGDRHDMG